MIQKFTNTFKNSIIKNVLLIALLFVSTMAFAQPGSIDPTFNTFDDGTLGDGSGFNGTVYSTVIQADGKIIVGGDFTSFNGSKAINRIARLNANGTIDTTFKTGLGFNNIVYSTSIQADGKIIVGGTFVAFDGTFGLNAIVRLNANGSMDTTFKTGVGFNGAVYSNPIQADGKIIVGGTFTSFNGTNGINRIVRLNTNGSLDTIFNIGTGFNSRVSSTSIQADGKIIVAGWFNSFNGKMGINHIARLNANGSLDTNFNTGSGFNNIIYSTSIQSNGKIIAGGEFTSFNGKIGVNRIIRLNVNGEQDTSFNSGTGFSSLGTVYSTSIQVDGKIILGGNFNSYNGVFGVFKIIRLHTNGSRDTTFNTDKGMNDIVRTTSIQADGKIFVGGDFTSFNNENEIKYSVRIHTNGKRDTSFNIGSGFNDRVTSISVQSDGKIIVGGHFTSYNGNAKINRIVRLNANGTRDTTFKVGTGFNGAVNSISIQADGKIIVGGEFYSFNGKEGINHIARLNTNGSLDNTFNVGSGFENKVNSTAIQTNGKIIVGGWFTSFNGIIDVNYIIRLNNDGSRDNSFNTGVGFENVVSSISIQTDGKIIIGGAFGAFNNNHGVKGIVRLNANGTQDNTFNAGMGFDNNVYSSSIQADGKIIVGGWFSSFNGTSGINRIVRLNVNGTRDTAFNSGIGFDKIIYTTSIQANGKIIVGGDFASFNGKTGINNIARLNSNGTIDTTFNASTEFNNVVNAISIGADGKIFVVGDFTSTDGKRKNRLVRLLDCFPSASSQNIINCGSYTWLANGVVYTSSGTYTTKLTNAVGCDSIITLNLTIKPKPVLITSVSGATITANETGATYQWIDCNNGNAPIAGATNQSYTATANGSYAVIVTKNTCSGTSACVNINTIGISTIASQSEQVTIYPNPNNGAFTISAESEGDYTIHNSLGQIIQTLTLNAANNYTVNIENLSNGIYFVTGYNNNIITQQKVVVAK